MIFLGRIYFGHITLRRVRREQDLNRQERGETDAGNGDAIDQGDKFILIKCRCLKSKRLVWKTNLVWILDVWISDIWAVRSIVRLYYKRPKSERSVGLVDQLNV